MEFLIFERFSEKEFAEELLIFLQSKNIDAILETSKQNFDPSFANNDFDTEFLIKLRGVDFSKAKKYLKEKYATEIEINLNNDYYLFDFTNEELLEILEKEDEWNVYDYVFAKKLLENRGIEINDEKINQLKDERDSELSKPEKHQKTWIIIGYITSFLGGLLGIFIGWHLYSYKKTIPTGQKIYAYSEKDRQSGKIIFCIGIVSLIFWLIIRYSFNY